MVLIAREKGTVDESDDDGIYGGREAPTATLTRITPTVWLRLVVRAAVDDGVVDEPGCCWGLVTRSG